MFNGNVEESCNFFQLGALTVELAQEESTLAWRAVLAGKINEDVNLGVIVVPLKKQRPSLILLDVQGVITLNSCGSREWILFLEQLKQIAPIEFLNLGEVFVEQGGVAPAILGSPETPIHRFDLPYVCERCDERSVVSVCPTEIVDSDEGRTGPTRKCGKCTGTLEQDVMGPEYFRFLEKRPKIARDSG